MSDIEPWAKGGRLSEALSAPPLELGESRPWYKRSGIFLLGILLLILLVGGLWTCGRSSSVAMQRAKDATGHFHQQFNQGDYAGIYAQAGEQFQNSGPEDEMAKLFGKIHEKLGNFVNTDGPKSYFVTASTNGIFITLTYASKFEEGEGEELFIWRVGTKEPQLVKYNINSKELVLK